MAADMEQAVENVAQQAEVKRMNKVSQFFLGMAIGAVVGGSVALLLAPQSGKDARAAWRGKAQDARTKFQEGVRNVKEKVGRMRKNMQSEAESSTQ